MMMKYWKKYNEVWNKIESLFKKEFNSEPVYNDKYIKTKISLNAHFYDNNNNNSNNNNNEMPKETERYTCLFVILLDSIINVDEKYYLQVFLIECKYAIKNKSVMNVIREQ